MIMAWESADILDTCADNSPVPQNLAALVRAIAWELIQLGYRPMGELGQVQRQSDDALRPVANEVLQAMKEILAGREP
jgi:uncharacterized membrane-anchored protein